VVVVFGNPLASRSETHRGDWDLVGSKPHARDCPRETFDAFRTDLESIYEEILALRGDSPVLIRAFDAYNPLYSVYREQGVYDECVQCFEYHNDAIQRAAEAYGVPVARVYDAFNGINHDEDPREKGYIGEDGVHTTPSGREVIAGLLRDLGYEPTVP
jgi:lysophospholipase L1-like esterase